MKVLVSGAVAALAIGAFSGHFARASLDLVTDGPKGPQMFADWAGKGTTGPFDDGTSFTAAYKVAAGGKVPDYVYGADWKRAMTGPSETAAVTRASYEPPARADDPALTLRDDTTAAERDPVNPAREPAYDAPPAEPDAPGAD